MEDVGGRSRWGRRAGLALGLLVVAVLASAGALLGPYVLDDFALDRVVRAVVLDWRDFGREQGLARLQHELDAQGIGMQVNDDDCALSEPAAGVKRVRCAWRAQVAIPWVGIAVPLSFVSQAEVGPDGELR